MDADGAEMFLATDAFGYHFVFNGGDGAEWKLRTLRGIDIEILDGGELGAFLGMRRTITGIWRFPSRKAVTVVPLMAAVTELATSRLGRPLDWRDRDRF